MRWLGPPVALLMLPATGSSAATPAVRSSALADFPSTTVHYYEVKGDTVTSINRSIRAQRAVGSGERVAPARTDWKVQAEFDREAVNERCKVTAARAVYSARVELPRLSSDSKLGKDERRRWDDYVGLLEQGSVATLAFVYQNLGQVETAIASSECDRARDAGEIAIAELRKHADQISASQEKRLAKLNEFNPRLLAESKVTCRDLEVTGGRLKTVRACLAAREWDRMWRTSSELTHEIVSKFSKLPRTPF